MWIYPYRILCGITIILMYCLTVYYFLIIITLAKNYFNS